MRKPHLVTESCFRFRCGESGSTKAVVNKVLCTTEFIIRNSAVFTSGSEYATKHLTIVTLQLFTLIMFIFVCSYYFKPSNTLPSDLKQVFKYVIEVGETVVGHVNNVFEKLTMFLNQALWIRA